ncbi:CPBP family intramembrane glutamic endopeptidase [Stackebrandtia endophytica]
MVDRAFGRTVALPVTKAVAALAVAGAAIATQPVVAADIPWPLIPMSLVAAAMLGAMWSLLLASHGKPANMPRLVNTLRLGLSHRSHGWLEIGSRAVVEEAIWRGLVAVLTAAAFGPVVALVASSVGFGLMHVHQGNRGIVVNIVNGAVFWVCGTLLGGLVAAILAHLAHNLVITGLVLGLHVQRTQVTSGGVEVG